MSEIVQLKIILKGTKPPIWRRLLIENTATFENLHYAIQMAMGWENSHLYEFVIDKQNTITELDTDTMDDDMPSAKKATLRKKKTI
ncbi:plasmid pRiA4b ORF-3 family protein [Chryseobacterium sp.]|uniref:plasmid pRiA4b ORF-3 family protein n=1 Tax=Chryseobacterium sp. TaxID=1871047 RepID=UPI0035B2614C